MGVRVELRFHFRFTLGGFVHVTVSTNKWLELMVQ